MSSNFKQIGLVGRYRQTTMAPTLVLLENWLNKNHYTVELEEQTAQSLQRPNQGLPLDQLCEEMDLLIVLGGDGSLLGVARAAADYAVPVLGINHGRLGFLTDIHPKTCIEEVEKVLAGEYLEEKRFLLEALFQQQFPHIETALNDIVLMPGPLPHMIEFEIYIDDEFVCSQRADGLITATPTGSTAYALSGGGPIVSPYLNAIVMVPMFPHTLSSRPIVIDSHQKINIILTDNNQANARVSCDGHERIVLPIGETLTLQRKKEELRLIHPKNYRYFETLRNKLGWAHKPTDNLE
ncbi:MAG: kinase [Gammaproteobacteria bacterium]|jgi:NAD+ kinase|nr:kinase [Gammaproteobacteria bacterium]